MAITDSQKSKLNKMNRAAQDITLGTMIQNLGFSTSGIALSASSVSAPLQIIQRGSGSAAEFGDGTNKLTITNNGTLLLSGCATTWDDFRVPLTQTKQGATAKPDFDYTNVGYLFPQNDPDEILYIIAQMPHTWKEGSDIGPHVHWRQTANQNAVFKISYAWTNNGSPISAFSTYVMDQPEFSFSSGSLMQLSAGSALISGVGKTLSSMLMIKLYREDNVYTGDALVYDFDIHYEKDSLGSNEEYNK